MNKHTIKICYRQNYTFHWIRLQHRHQRRPDTRITWTDRQTHSKTCFQSYQTSINDSIWSSSPLLFPPIPFSSLLFLKLRLQHKCYELKEATLTNIPKPVVTGIITPESGEENCSPEQAHHLETKTKAGGGGEVKK